LNIACKLGTVFEKRLGNNGRGSKESCKTGALYEKFLLRGKIEVSNLTTLETRRIRGDLIEVSKILKGYNGVHAPK
jgi:hypothetical protein